MASSRSLSVLGVLGALAALASCKGKEAGTPPVDDGGAGPPGRERKLTPGVIPDAASSAKDRLGDPLPVGATARLGSLRMLDRHLESMRFLPGGAQLVSASYDRYVVWDAKTGARVFELERRDVGPALAVSPSGRLMATSVAGSPEIQMWDLAGRKALPVLRGEREVKSLCFLDDKSLVAAADGLVLVLDATATPPADPMRVTGEFAKLTSMACAAQVVAVGDDAGSVFAIDLRKAVRAAQKLGEAAKRVGAVAVSPDGATVAAGSDDGNALVWALADPKTPVTIQAHDRQVASLQFAPDGKRLWTSGGDAWLRSWNAADGALDREMTAIEGLTVQYVAVSPDGKRAATWSHHRGAKGSEAGRFWLWDLSNGDQLAEPERHAEGLTSVVFSPDGGTIATGSEDQTVRLWKAPTGEGVSVLTAAQAAVNALHYAKDGKTLYEAGGDGKLVTWRPSDDAVTDALPPIGGKVNTFDLAPDGARAVTGDETGRVWTWDLGARAKVQALDRQTYASITSVAFSPDGKLIAITGSERVVLVIGADSGSEAARLSPDVVSNFAAAFSPDGSVLVTAGDDARVRLWDTKTWKQLRVLEGHDGSVRCVAFSPDGKRVASGSNDTTARVWDVAGGSSIAELKGQTGAVTAVSFSPDGKQLATASHDRTGLVWTAPP